MEVKHAILHFYELFIEYTLAKMDRVHALMLPDRVSAASIAISTADARACIIRTRNSRAKKATYANATTNRQTFGDKKNRQHARSNNGKLLIYVRAEIQF